MTPIKTFPSGPSITPAATELGSASEHALELAAPLSSQQPPTLASMGNFVPNGGLHPVAQNPGAGLRANSGFDVWDKICAFFGDDNGVGDLSEDLAKKSAEL